MKKCIRNMKEALLELQDRHFKFRKSSKRWRQRSISILKEENQGIKVYLLADDHDHSRIGIFSSKEMALVAWDAYNKFKNHGCVKHHPCIDVMELDQVILGEDFI